MITRLFGEQERSFVLHVAQWRDLEKARDLGLGQIAQRLAPLVQLKAAGLAQDGDLLPAVAAGFLGSARLDDVREPLLRGLIGGGLTSTEAGGLVQNIFDEEVALGRAPMLTWCDLAFNIVMEAMLGLADEEEVPGEKAGAGEKSPDAPRSPTEKPAS